MPYVCAFQQLAGSSAFEPVDKDRPPGQNGQGDRIFHVVDVPGGVSAEEVKKKLEKTVFGSPRYIVPYCLLGQWPPGKSPGGTLLSVAEIADLSDLAKVSIRKFISRGQIPASRIGRDWFVHENDFVWWMTRKTGPGRPAGNRS